MGSFNTLATAPVIVGDTTTLFGGQRYVSGNVVVTVAVTNCVSNEIVGITAVTNYEDE